jgi:hypothetical protein
MQADGGDSPAGRDGHSKSPRWLERVKTWDSEFSVTKGLTVVTVLTGFLGGYFQYLNAYDEKVSAQAKDDMAAATATFVEISNAFAQAQLLQQLIYFDLRDVLNDKSDDADKAMSTKNARDVFPDYLKARNLPATSTAIRRQRGPSMPTRSAKCCWETIISTATVPSIFPISPIRLRKGSLRKYSRIRKHPKRTFASPRRRKSPTRRKRRI